SCHFGFRQRLAHLFRHIIYMAGIKRRSFRKRTVIAARRLHRSQATDKLHAHALFYFFNLPQQDTANLSCGADMCATARSPIGIGNVDEAKVASLFWWKLAKAELPRFFERHKANANWTVFCDDLVSQQLRLLRLCGGKTIRFKIDGAAFLAHVKADGRHVEEPDECGGEHMLP